MQKIIPFLLLKQLFICEKTPLGFNSYGNILAFESFLILSNVSKLLCDQPLMILQVQLMSDVSLHKVSLQFFKFFQCTRAFFIFDIKIIIFEASKPISACCFRQSMVAVSLNKNPMCFSCRFFFLIK